MISATPIFALRSGFVYQKPSFSRRDDFATTPDVLPLKPLTKAATKKNSTTSDTQVDWHPVFEKVKNNALLSVILTAALAYGIVHPKSAWNIGTAVPKAIWNLPKTGKAILDSRPMIFLPYKPTLIDTSLKLFRPLNIIKLGNMSLPDWTSRLMTLGLYIPQGYFAIKYQRQPYETWGRNFLVWLSTFYLIMMSKKPDFPINLLFNQLFLPKQKTPKGILSKLVNPIRPEFNYLECFKRAGINLDKIGAKGDLSKIISKNAFWATLDLNELRQIKFYVERLKNRFRATSEIRLLREKIKVEKFLNNMLVMNVLKNLALAVLTAYCIGVLVPYLVFKYISPLDKQFARPKMRYVMPPSEIDKLKQLNTLASVDSSKTGEG